MSDISTIIQEQFQTLPKVIQDTILTSNWQEKIRRIVKSNNLHVDQGAAIENLVIITMLGIETPENFVKLAQEYANVNYDQALGISSEVEREIFGDIRKKLIDNTDSVGTISEIDKTTNELDKVAAAIEKESKKVPETKPSLKAKIPSDYFDPNKTSITPSNVPATTTDPKPPEINTKITENSEKEPDPYREPATLKAEEKPIPTKIEKPLFTPMPKTIVENLISNEKTEDSSPKTITKIDPYREPIA